MSNKIDCEIGSYIYVCGYGWCLVVRIKDDVVFPLVLKSSTGSIVTINSEGKMLANQENPVAFTYDPIDGTEHPKRIEYVNYLGTSIPKFLTSYPPNGCEYYFRGSAGDIRSLNWCGGPIDMSMFSYGIWIDREEAEIAIEAINKVMKVN